jgi:predicted NBD/HSP70 family sugar kinase
MWAPHYTDYQALGLLIDLPGVAQTLAAMVKLVDTRDLKSLASISVPVRVRVAAPRQGL